MEKLIAEIREWLSLKEDEALILSTEYRMAKTEGYGNVAGQQIYNAYVAVMEQRAKLTTILAILS